MAPRLSLQAILLGFVSNVYFQPPPSVALTYPCIVYKRDDRKTVHADNQPYGHNVRYMVTVIDSDPDSAIPDMVAGLPTAQFERAFQAENLNHDVYNLYF